MLRCETGGKAKDGILLITLAPILILITILILILVLILMLILALILILALTLTLILVLILRGGREGAGVQKPDDGCARRLDAFCRRSCTAKGLRSQHARTSSGGF